MGWTPKNWQAAAAKAKQSPNLTFYEDTGKTGKGKVTVGTDKGTAVIFKHNGNTMDKGHAKFLRNLFKSLGLLALALALLAAGYFFVLPMFS